jgi:hypothetical protein
MLYQEKSGNPVPNSTFLLQDNDEPACSPRDFLNTSSYFLDAIYSQSELVSECLPACFQQNFGRKLFV